MRCPTCAADVPEGAAACPSCGSAFGGAAPKKPTSEKVLCDNCQGAFPASELRRDGGQKLCPVCIAQKEKSSAREKKARTPYPGEAPLPGPAGGPPPGGPEPSGPGVPGPRGAGGSRPSSSSRVAASAPPKKASSRSLVVVLIGAVVLIAVALGVAMMPAATPPATGAGVGTGGALPDPVETPPPPPTKTEAPVSTRSVADLEFIGVLQDARPEGAAGAKTLTFRDEVRGKSLVLENVEAALADDCPLGRQYRIQYRAVPSDEEVQRVRYTLTAVKGIHDVK